MYLLIILSLFIIAGFILLLPKNDGLNSLMGSSQKTTIPFSRSEKIYFLLGIFVMFIIYYNNKYFL